jgi:hypothetical protein
MSTLIQDVTLRQILNLYEGLLRNDGVDSPRPFYMQLGVRPNFAKRLGSLATGFREGKGLSELIPMVEHSNSPEASLEEARDKHRGDSKTEEFEREEFDDVAEEYDDVQDNPEISQVVAHEADLKSSNLVGNSSDKPGEHQSNDLTTVLSPEAESAQIVGGSGNGKYEEDLIDYSDEEVERPEKQKKPNEIASDEEHFVDSVPGSTKDTLPEQSAPYAEPSDIDDEVHKEEAGIGYEEENDESYYLETEVHEEATAYDETETWEHEGNIELLVSQNGLEANGESNDLESDHEEPEDEIGYDEGHDAETRDLYDEDLGLEGSTEKPLEEERAINHALSNLASSENGTSEKTLEGSAGADETPEDEIDYDDDDDLATSGAQESLPGGDVSVSIDGSGKRQREDANLDEGMSMRSKGASIFKFVEDNPLTGPTDAKRRKS